MQVGFAQPSFPASESVGSVSVCINIFGAELNRSVTVVLSTQDGTAVCELYMYYLLHFTGFFASGYLQWFMYALIDNILSTFRYSRNVRSYSY